MIVLFRLILLFSGLSFLGGSALFAQPSLVEKPDVFPNLIVGKDGLIYELVYDENSERVELPDGRLGYRHPVFLGDPQEQNAAYEAIVKSRSDGAEAVDIVVAKSYRQLRQEWLLASSRIEPSENQWHLNQISIRLSAAAILAILQSASANQDRLKEILGLHNAPQKANLLSDFIFSGQVSLDEETLFSIRRSAQNPKPEPISFNVKIPTEFIADLIPPAFLSDRLKASVLDSFYRMERRIFLDHLTFFIRQRQLSFDPSRQVMSFALDSEKVRLSGNMRDIGEVYPLFEWYFYDQRPSLTEGLVDGINISFDMKMLQERYSLGSAPTEFWNLGSRVDESFRLDFGGSEPKVSLKLEKTSNWWGGERPAYTDKDELVLSEGSIPHIERPLRKMLKDSLGKRFFKDSLGFSVPIEHPWVDSQRSEQLDLQFRVGDLVFHQDGVEVFLDVRTSLTKEILTTPILIDSPSSYFPREQQAEGLWGFQWVQQASSPDSKPGWQLYRDEEGLDDHVALSFEEPFLEMRLHHGLLQRLSDDFFYAGLFVFDADTHPEINDWIPGRALELASAPKLEMVEQGVLVLDLAFKSPIALHPEIPEVISTQSKVWIEADRLHFQLLDFDYPDATIIEKEALNSAVQEYLSRLFKIQLEPQVWLKKISWLSFLEIDQWALQMGSDIHSVQVKIEKFEPGTVRLPRVDFPDRSSQQDVEAHRSPLSFVSIKCPKERISQNVVKIEWSSQNPDLEYRYRLERKSFDSDEWIDVRNGWSLPESQSLEDFENKKPLSFQETLAPDFEYRFRLAACYKSEQCLQKKITEDLRCNFSYWKNSEILPRVDQINSEVTTPKAKLLAEPQPEVYNSAAPKGLFGCQLRAVGRVDLLFLVLLSLLGGLILRGRNRKLLNQGGRIQARGGKVAAEAESDSRATAMPHLTSF